MSDVTSISLLVTEIRHPFSSRSVFHRPAGFLLSRLTGRKYTGDVPRWASTSIAIARFKLSDLG